MMTTKRARGVSILAGAVIAGCAAGSSTTEPKLPPLKPRVAEASVDVEGLQEVGLVPSTTFRVNGRLQFNEGPTPSVGGIVVRVVVNEAGHDVISDSAIGVVDHLDAAMLTFHAAIRAPPKPGPCRVDIIHNGELLTTVDQTVRFP